MYEYDLPLFNPAHCRFEFVSPEESELANPWKESFRQLYRGVHVRPGYQDMSFRGRNLVFFNTVQVRYFYSHSNFIVTMHFIAQGALEYADERNGSNSTANSVASACGSHSSVSDGNMSVGSQQQQGTLIFLHAGTYRGEFLVIDSDIALIGNLKTLCLIITSFTTRLFSGAAPGNVAESVILERESESTVMFVEGAKCAYAGHLTFKFSPDVTSTVPHHKHYCLEVGENCSPTIDHCIIRSTSVGKLV